MVKGRRYKKLTRLIKIRESIQNRKKFHRISILLFLDLKEDRPHLIIIGKLGYDTLSGTTHYRYLRSLWAIHA